MCELGQAITDKDTLMQALMDVEHEARFVFEDVIEWNATNFQRHGKLWAALQSYRRRHPLKTKIQNGL